MGEVYHKPVMLAECLEGLAIEPHKIYVDVTFGGGGHSKAILHKLTTGKLLSFDQDEDAKVNLKEVEQENFVFIAANFRFLKKYLRLHGYPKVDGILADLGISSHQIDEEARGFSTRGSAELDMRMDKEGTLTAKDIINEYNEEQLRNLFKFYGEIKNAGRVAQTILRKRAGITISKTDQLMDILSDCAPKGKENKYFAQVFQAIRIEVNDELGALKEMLQQTSEVLHVGGRLVIMSYHSLEDRLVKNFMKTGNFSGELEKDFYGNPLRPFKPVQSKPKVASDEEVNLNRRARSAKLRIADKL